MPGPARRLTPSGELTRITCVAGDELGEGEGEGVGAGVGCALGRPWRSMPLRLAVLLSCGLGGAGPLLSPILRIGSGPLQPGLDPIRPAQWTRYPVARHNTTQTHGYLTHAHRSESHPL